MAENHRALLREWNLPRWSAGYWGERTAGALAALPADLAAEAAAIAARGSMLYDAHPRPPSVPDETPGGAVAALGSDSGMPLGTTPDALARLTTALRARWTHATGGPRAWLESELARMGYAPLFPLEVDTQRRSPAPVLQAVGTQVGAGATIVPAWPAHATGDLGVLYVSVGATATVATPAGWDLEVQLQAGNGAGLWIYSRTATSGAESGATVSTGDAIVRRAVICTYRGAGGAFFDAVTSNAPGVASATTVAATAPALGGIGRERVLAVAWAGATTGSGGYSISGYSGVPGFSESVDVGGGGGGCAIAVAHGTAATGGPSYGPVSATWSAAVHSACALLSVRGPSPSSIPWHERFWLTFPEGAHQALGNAAVVGGAVVGVDSIGPFTQPEWALWFRNLVATVERARPAQWVCWDYEFRVPDGTIRIMSHYRFQDPDYVYFTAA